MHDVKETEGTTHEFKLVSLIRGIDTVEIEKWLVSPGDEVAKDQPLVEVVTDLIGLAFGPTHIGATLLAPRAGKILLTRGQEGETVSLPSVLVAYAVDRGEPAAIDDRSTADPIAAMVRSLAELTRRRDEAAVAERKNEHIIGVCLSDHDQKRDELLRRFGKAALEPLLKLLTEEPLGHVRFEAATLVRELRSHAAIPELVRALADARDDVRATARDTLGGFDPRHVRAALLRALADGSAAVRCAAVAELARLGDASIVHEIERRLDDEDAAVRHAAALGLVEFHPERAGDALSRLQRDPDEAHRSDAVALVARLAAGPDALERLAPWAGDPSPAVRGQVYAALAGHLQSERGEALLKPLLRHTDAGIRMDAATALASIGSPLASQALVDLSRDPSPGVRRQALSALSWLLYPHQVHAAHLASALRDPDPGVRLIAASALAPLRNPKVAAHLASALRDPDVRVRIAAVDGLAGLMVSRRTPLLPTLAAALGDEISWEQQGRMSPLRSMSGHVLDAIGRVLAAAAGDGAAGSTSPRSDETRALLRGALVRALTQTPSAPVEIAAGVARLLADPALAPALALALSRNAPFPGRSQPLCAALDAIGDAAVAPLADALAGADPEARQAAAEALERYAAGEAVDALLAALGDPAPAVRASAAAALAAHGGGRAVEPLIRALGDPEHAVCCKAALALGKLGDGRAVRPLVDLVEGLLQRRVERLEDPEYNKLMSGVRALAYLRDPSTLELIARSLSHADFRVRRDGARSLGYFGGPVARELLRFALQDGSPEVRRFARDALASMSG
ncbi:HEAT repeat domain-containing protein [Sorangium sp. So ce385]|uniref:HEAT repeat domain-containing protein n=1 Tax=Sorangium sp. So ce385 TaxID=3133308 RepID=UPI003F5BC90C